MALTEEILLRLGLDQSSLARGLREGREKIHEFGKETKEQFTDIFKEFATPLTLAGGIVAIEKLFGKVETIERTAEATGLSVEQFQRLAYAAQHVGVESSAMEKSLDFLAKTLGEAGGTGPEAKAAAEKFYQFGISIRDASGHLKSTGEILDEISNKMAAMPDVASRAAMAVELLGKSGAKLVSILGEGSGSLHERGRNAAIISDDDIENIHRAHNALIGVENTATSILAKSLSGWVKLFDFFRGDATIRNSQKDRDQVTGQTSTRIAEMARSTRERMEYEEAQRKKIEDQLHRIAVRHREEDAQENADLQTQLETQLHNIAARHARERVQEEMEERRTALNREFLLRRQEETELAISVKKNQGYYSNVHELAQQPGWGWAYQTARDIEYREQQSRSYVLQYGARGQEFEQYRDYTARLREQLEQSGYIQPEQTMEHMNDHLATISERLNLSTGLPVDPVIH